MKNGIPHLESEMKKFLIVGIATLALAASAEAKGPLRTFLFGGHCGCPCSAAARQTGYAPAPMAMPSPTYRIVSAPVAPMTFEIVRSAPSFSPLTYTHDFPVVNAVRSQCQNGKCPK